MNTILDLFGGPKRASVEDNIPNLTVGEFLETLKSERETVRNSFLAVMPKPGNAAMESDSLTKMSLRFLVFSLLRIRRRLERVLEES